MGAVNYATSDYITLGVDLNRVTDPDEIAELFDAVESAIDSLGVWAFCVRVKPGYYEGFTLDIEYNYPVCYDHAIEKRDALKDVTVLKRGLLALCRDFGLVAVYPGWCTGYSTPAETRAAICAAVAEMRKDVKATPTYSQYCRGVRLCVLQLSISCCAVSVILFRVLMIHIQHFPQIF